MKIQVMGPMFLENIAFFLVAHGGDPAASRLSVHFDATEAVVASVHVFKALRRQGISTALHDVAFEWATSKNLKFYSGVITSDENQAYWEKLETAKQAQRTATGFGEMFIRTR